jgi:predicted dehydrogenase
MKTDRKARIGVVGSGRGQSMMDYCVKYGNAELVAICDNYPPALERARRKYGDAIAYYDDFETFLSHDMDAVVLANFANEHAPFAIRCMESGKNVLSEVLPVQSMQEAVQLVETVERTGLLYAYGENCCFMPSARKMRDAYRAGRLGTFEYGEGEYMHNCESGWDALTYGDPNHWRNTMSAFYYCTHSMGPMIHVSGLRPVRVTGFEAPFNDRMYRMGAKAGPFGIEMVTLENGGVIKSIHGGLYKNSVWYAVYGAHGRMESAREDAGEGVERLYVNADAYDGEYANRAVESCRPAEKAAKESAAFGHGGSDYFSMYNFVQKILGDETADTIDVFEALDMFLPGMFAYRSILQGGVSVPIPDLRDPAEREKWRGDTACTDPKVAGEQLLPTMSTGTPQIGKEVYDKMYALWRKDFTSDDGYTNAAMTQGSKKE